MRPTQEWAERKYDEANEKFFGGELGDCDFSFKTGLNHTLGTFKITAPLKFNTVQRKLFKDNGMDRTFVDSENFYEMAKPVINFNINYEASEDAWFNTLVHEMCHYATYFNGNVPKQGHGPEFRRWAAIVNSRSNGEVKITRLDKTGSHQMDDELKQKMIDRRNKRRDTVATNAKVLLRKQEVRTGSEGYSPVYSFVIPINQTKAMDIAKSWFEFAYNSGREVEIWISDSEELKLGLLNRGYKTTRTDNLPSYYILTQEKIGQICGDYSIDEFIALFNFRELEYRKDMRPKIKEDFRRFLGYGKSPLLVEYVKHMEGHRNSKGEEAPWVIVSHKTGKVLSSHKTKKDAENHLQHMHIFAK